MISLLSRWWMMGVVVCLGGWAKVAAAPASANSPGPEVIARVHSRGMLDVVTDANGSTFKEIWNLPVSSQLRDEALEKLATVWATHFTAKQAGTTADCARLLRPLLNDLFNAEVFLEVTERSPDRLETTLALRLDDARSRVWQNNWNQFLAHWNLHTAHGTDRLWTLSQGGWFAVQCVSGNALDSDQPPKSAMVDQIKQGQRPVAKAGDYWLRVESDLPRLSRWFLARPHDDWPRVDWTIAGRKEYLRSQGRLTFREAAVPRVEKWEIPINTIRDPLISFTALQGLGPWLKRQPIIRELGLDSLPNQFYLWGLSQTAFQIQAAVPVPNATNAFDRIAEKGVSKYNQTLTEFAVGNIRRLPDRAELLWRGLPILVPYLRPVQNDGRGFLHAGIFPVDPPTNAPPQQLFQQLTSQTNLLYYDWEITQAQLNQLRPLLQLSAVFLTLSPMSTNSSAYKWLDAIEPRLGNTITELSAASPRELQFLRTSHLGFNGLELLTLANWLEGTNFPKLNLDVRFRPIVTSKRQKEAH